MRQERRLIIIISEEGEGRGSFVCRLREGNMVQK